MVPLEHSGGMLLWASAVGFKGNVLVYFHNFTTTLLLVAPAQLLPKDHVQPGPESSCCAIRLDDLPGWILILSVWQLSKPLPPTSEEYQHRGRENPFNQHPRRRTLCRPVTLLLLAIYCLQFFLNIEGDIVFFFLIWHID